MSWQQTILSEVRGSLIAVHEGVDKTVTLLAVRFCGDVNGQDVTWREAHNG